MTPFFSVLDGISYRDLKGKMVERGVEVIIQRYIIGFSNYAPVILVVILATQLSCFYQSKAEYSCIANRTMSFFLL